jgi:hypothetical protein
MADGLRLGGSYAEGRTLRHFEQMLAINPNLGEAEYARKNVAAIQQTLLAKTR